MNTPKKYRKKPVTIEAVQWDGTVEGATPIIDWVLAGGGNARWLDLDATAWINIDTLEGTMRADADDYIVRGVQGEFYPVKPDIFAATYEEEEGVSATSRAADVIAQSWPNGRGVRKDDSAILARALADAGLLAPELPEANDPTIFVPGGKGWLLDGPEGPVVWTAPGGTVMVQRIEPGELTPEQARIVASHFLAAADYAEEVGTDEE